MTPFLIYFLYFIDFKNRGEWVATSESGCTEDHYVSLTARLSQAAASLLVGTRGACSYRPRKNTPKGHGWRQSVARRRKTKYLYSKARTSHFYRSLQRYTLRTRHGRSELPFCFFAHVHNYKYANDMIEWPVSIVCYKTPQSLFTSGISNWTLERNGEKIQQQNFCF